MKKAKVNPENASEIPAAEEAAAAEPAKKTVNKVGRLLKEMRLQKGLRLPDVAKRLCIRRIYLEAIEESDYKEIPPFPYGVGFIRSYADFLGLNSGNIVELYKEETNITPEKDIYVLEPQSEATVPNRKYLIISLLAVILVYVLWFLYNNRIEEEVVAVAPAVEENNPEAMPIVVEDYAIAPEATEAEAPLPVVETTGDAGQDQVTITEASFVEPAPAAEPVAAVEQPEPEEGVVIKIKEETWIEVKDGSKLYISKVLKPGAEYVVPEGGRGMILSVGKIEGAEVYVNGKLTPVAKPGKKTNIALDPFIAAAH